ncbi:MAG: PKD domain-containing protein [Bacilli bacterium]
MKWITVQGQDREGKGLHYLIHGAHDLQVGDRVLVFPSADRRIPYAAAKGLAIEAGARVVAVPHSKMPWSRIRTSIFANDALPPTANFTVDATYGYQPFEVSFTDISYANPPATAWHWDFGDGATSEEQHPTHTYPGIGWYTVTLTVTNGLGSDTLRKEALIYSGVDFPVDLVAVRTGPSTAAIYWEPGANNTQVVIARRHDFYPPHPNNAVRVYQGAAGGSPTTDSGLQAGQEYYYRVWGIRDGILSEGYRSADLPIDPQSLPIHVTDAWSRAVAYPGESVSYGPYSYTWDGGGRVYLSASPTSVQAVTVDDGPVIITEHGTINHVAATWSGICEITSILRPGVNQIRVDVRDNPYYALSIGAKTPLYIMRTL